MSKRNRQQRRQQTQQQAQNSTPQQKGVMDAFTNALARTGYGQPNILESTDYPLTRLTRNYTLMNSLYRSNWIVKKIINTVPEDMLKNWFEISSEITPEALDRFDKMVRKTQIKDKMLDAMYWARLYGGAACLMLIDGHQNKLHEPLNLDDVMPNSFKGLMVLDRWSGIYPESDIIDDIGSSEFGMPEFYNITNNVDKIGTRVHHSRIIRFPGRKLPFWEEQAEIYWGASEIEHIFEELKKRDNTSYNIASLVFKANLLFYKIDGMNQFLVNADPQAQADLYNTVQAMNRMMNNNSMQIIDSTDDFFEHQYTFSGINEIYESFMLDISGACDIPATKLFGRAPAGMNATGESDLQNYYDMVGQQQETYLRPPIEKVLPVMFVAEFGYVPDDLDFRFNPVRTPSDKEIAELVKNKADAVIAVFNAGLINKKTGMKELKAISNETGMFTNITDEDIENAVDDDLLGDVPPKGGDDTSSIFAVSQKSEIDNHKMSDDEYLKRYGKSR